MPVSMGGGVLPFLLLSSPHSQGRKLSPERQGKSKITQEAAKSQVGAQGS